MYQRIQTCPARQTSIRKAELTALPHRKHVPRPQGDISPEYDDAAGQLVVKLVSVLDRVAVADLHGTSRGKAGICLSRQKAMYLMHTVFSSPYHTVAAFFRRDRTTIAHACRLVEDMRDDEDFDRQLEAMENLLVSARNLYEISDRGVADA
ncbi:MAG: hypothetical protein KDJ80_13790 [Nitratireductor sp.]|nr:hypothetical protein [Nitratireductor sp.]